MELYQYSEETREEMESLMQPLGVYQFVDGRPVTLLVSDGFCKLYEFSDRTEALYFLEHGMYSNLHPDDRAHLSGEALRFFQNTEESFDVSFRIRIGQAADYHVIHARGEHVQKKNGVHLAHIWYMDEGLLQEDGGKPEEERIVHAAMYDELTGLPTLTLFFKLSEIWRDRVCGEGKEAVLLYTDLNGMKLFNQKYGFAEGDQLLKSYAEILIRHFGNENCCHVDGDHFAMFSTGDKLKTQLQLLFRDTEHINGGRTLPVRVGTYSTAVENVPVASAYDRAKMACGAIPASDFSASNEFSRELLEKVRRQQYVIANVDRAIRERWIQVYCQPIVRAVNEMVCDEEALARWIDPEMGFLSPADFIPPLENAGLIYKLDLCVLDQVLEKLRVQMDQGVEPVPHSINLSRSDFTACDIVEEIRKRVDAMGVRHDKITIEITESTVGSDVSFMREQIERFRDLGFPVWMDDFGAGYSSFDVLQSIPFDLIKIDMSFMRKLDQYRGVRVVLTELIKMASALGLDTVCEGVETEGQVRFLQEIGCSKLQGYYFSKPLPPGQALQRNSAGIPLVFEDQKTAAYFETIGRVNLYDLDVIANLGEGSFGNTFSMLPMGVLEVTGDTARFVRSNAGYREFMSRFFNVNVQSSPAPVRFDAAFVQNIVETCCEQGGRAIYNEKMPDGSVVHSFTRRIAVNPINGAMAIVIAILSVSDPSEGETYADIARALATDYRSIYIVDMDTDEFFEYSSSVGGEHLAMERQGENFFDSAVRETATRIYEEDREPFLSWFSKDNISRNLEEHGVFTATYRLMDTGMPEYYNMKVTRMLGTNRIILGVSNVDSQMKHREHLESVLMEQSALSRIMAISEDYLSLYSIDPDTGHYVEFTATPEYETLGIAKEGTDFFLQSIENSKMLIHPDDLQRFLAAFTRENVLAAIQNDGKFTLSYRLIIHENEQSIFLKIVPFHDGQTNKLLASIRKWRNRE